MLSFTFRAISIITRFFSRFYDTDDEILRQNRNLACVIYFSLPAEWQKTINRRGFYSRKRDIIVNDFDNRRELCGMTAVNRRQMADIDVSSRDVSR
jgi:hypothetical protein